MARFRIALGSASCKDVHVADPATVAVCRVIFERVEKLKLLNSAQLSSFPAEEQEQLSINGKLVRITTYLEQLASNHFLIVVQAFYSTLSRPNYFSLGGVGKMLAEGICFDHGVIRDATDEELWSYR